MFYSHSFDNIKKG